MSDIPVTMTAPGVATVPPETPPADADSEALLTPDEIANDFNVRRIWPEGLSAAIFQVNTGADPDAAHVDEFGNWQLGPRA